MHAAQAPGDPGLLQRDAPGDPRHYSLRLYVAGQTPKSLAAIRNLNAICETHLAGRYTIVVIDLRLHPQLAAGDQILALPTLVRHLPTPLTRIIGDLSNTDKVLVGLDLRTVEAARPEPSHAG